MIIYIHEYNVLAYVYMDQYFQCKTTDDNQKQQTKN